MNEPFYMILPAPDSAEDGRRLLQLSDRLKQDYPDRMTTIEDPAALEMQACQGRLAGCRILFLAALGRDGICTAMYQMLGGLRRHPGCLKDSRAGIVVDALAEDYTKAEARRIALTLNRAGCLLIGRPLVEATGSLRNLDNTAAVYGVDRSQAYELAVRDLIERLYLFVPPEHKRAKLLCLHASNRKTSNTYRLWNMVREQLSENIEVTEIALRNGTIHDCNGCPFETCMYYSSHSSCYFGGAMVEEVYPAMQDCDALMLLCPNYNDALGANLTAVINRLTALFRKTPFSDKYLYSIIVSGYSGGDLIAAQLIDALNMNKSFILPPEFALYETANKAGSVELIPGIREQAAAFAERINERLFTEET